MFSKVDLPHPEGPVSYTHLEEQMDREKYYEQILNAVDTGILVVDSHDNILQHNQAALRLLDTDAVSYTHLHPLTILSTSFSSIPIISRK